MKTLHQCWLSLPSRAGEVTQVYWLSFHAAYSSRQEQFGNQQTERLPLGNPSLTPPLSTFQSFEKCT